MKNQAQWLVFEGLDKAGKTTLAKELATESAKVRYLKGICAHTILGSLNRRFPTTLLLVIEALLSAYQAKIWKRKGFTVIQDRYIASVACHLPVSGVFPANIVVALALKLFPKPDSLVYIWVDKEERLRRLKESSKDNKQEEWLVAHPQWIDVRDQAYDDYFRKFIGRKLKIDTTDESIDTSLFRIKCFIY